MEPYPDRTDNLSLLERRLSAWQPATGELDADAMLFAAGRASVQPRRGRFLWPALTVLLCALLTAQGVWLAIERSERLTLAQQLRSIPPAPVPAVFPPSDAGAPSGDEAVMPGSYLSSRPALEKGLEAWTPLSQNRTNSVPAPANDTVYQVGHRDLLLNP